MSRLESALKGGDKLVGFIMGGDPSYDECIKAAEKAIEGGADVLEIGLAFSDPLADGPTIQAAAQRALFKGMNTKRYFRLCKAISSRHETPLVCLTYYNIIHRFGCERFARSCSLSGICGVIVPDLPIEHSKKLKRALVFHGVDLVFLVAETTPDERIKKICSFASGFIYVVALLGTTGVRESLDPKAQKLIKRIRRHTRLPLALGFGLSNPDQVMQAVRMGADAAIVGSALVSVIHSKGDVRGFVSELKAAILEKGF